MDDIALCPHWTLVDFYVDKGMNAPHMEYAYDHFAEGESPDPPFICFLYLIRGNHDERYLRDKDFDISRFEWVKDYAEIHDNKRKIVLMHYPIFCYNGQFRRGVDGTPLTYMLHGHIHKSEDQELVDRFCAETKATRRKTAHQEEAQPVPCQIINCFCMYSDYTPLTLEEWIECDQRQRAQLCMRK